MGTGSQTEPSHAHRPAGFESSCVAWADTWCRCSNNTSEKLITDTSDNGPGWVTVHGKLGNPRLGEGNMSYFLTWPASEKQYFHLKLLYIKIWAFFSLYQNEDVSMALSHLRVSFHLRTAPKQDSQLKAVSWIRWLRNKDPKVKSSKEMSMPIPNIRRGALPAIIYRRGCHLIFPSSQSLLWRGFLWIPLFRISQGYFGKLH